jgi:DNA-binding NarL/FixJ family response regulator
VAAPARAVARRVLVVEGDRASRNLLCRALDRDQRFEVVASVGYASQALAFQGTFDLALVDLLVDASLDVLGALRARVPSPALLVLAPAVASYLRAAVASAGGHGLVSTRIGMRELLDLMADCCSSRALCSGR